MTLLSARVPSKAGFQRSSRSIAATLRLLEKTSLLWFRDASRDGQETSKVKMRSYDLGVDHELVARTIFKESAGGKPITGLIRS